MNDLSKNELSVIAESLSSREDVEELQRHISKMPQANTMVTEDYFSGGMYCRKLWRQKGTAIIGKVHKKDHLFICAMGEIVVFGNGKVTYLKSGDVIESKAGTKRVTFALTDAIGMTIHKTDLTDVSEIEKELIEEDVTALFDANNLQKSGIIEAER